ncbi:MAG: hypothetical protein ACI9VR_003583 [Cognaticolwellia sp.]|jgi:hypothetical protein
MATGAGPLLLLFLLSLCAQVGAAVPLGFAPGRMVALESLLLGQPHDPNLNAEYALGLSSTGRCSQAEPHWDLGADLAGTAQADCLRERGQARQAAALRELEILASNRPFLHHLAQAHDLREAGDLLAAEQAALRAAALQPQSKRLLAFWMELALDRGQLAEAQTILSLSQDLPGRSPSELLLARARFLLAQGALEEAQDLVLQVGARGRQPARAACLRVRILVGLDDAPLALSILEQPRLGSREELCLIRSRVVVHAALGEAETAKQWEKLLWALAPQGTLDTEGIPDL